MGDAIAVHTVGVLDNIVSMLLAGVTNNSQAIRVASINATTSYILGLGEHDEVMKLNVLLPPCFTMVQQAITDDDEDMLMEAIEVIEEAITISKPLINEHMEDVVQMALHLTQNSNLEASTRNMGAMLLTTVIESRPKLLGKKGLVEPILSAMMESLVQLDPAVGRGLFNIGGAQTNGVLEEEDEEIEEDDGVILAKIPQYILDSMAMNISSKYFVEPALQICGQYMMTESAAHKKAGCAALGGIAEGCSDPIKMILNQILEPLLACMTAEEGYVREVACFCLGQISEHCQPEILTYNKMVLPVIVESLSDTETKVQATTCYVLEMFCENLQPNTLAPFLEMLLGKITALFGSPSRATRELALSALAATAVAAEEKFAEYSDQIVTILNEVLFLESEQDFTLRGRALECLGHIAVGIGKENFKRYYDLGITAASQAVNHNNDTLKEYAFVYFANVARTMGEDIGPHLEAIVSTALTQIAHNPFNGGYDRDDDDSDEDEENENAAITNNGQQQGAEEDDESFGDMYIQEGFAEAKKAAVTAIGSCAEHTGALFAQYVEQSFSTIVSSALNDLDDIRAEAIEQLPHLVKSARLASSISEDPTPDQTLSLSPELEDLSRIVLLELVTTMRDDREKKNVACALEAAVQMLQTLGVAAMNIAIKDEVCTLNWAYSSDANRDNVAQYCETLYGLQDQLKITQGGAEPIGNLLLGNALALLREQMPCQKNEEGGEEGQDAEDEDEADHDEIIMDNVADLIGQLAKTLKGDFEPLFKELFPDIIKYANRSSYTDKAMALGCVAEVIANIGPAAINYSEAILEHIVKGLSNDMEMVRRNAVYCLGVLIESTGDQLVAHFMTILEALAPLCARSADQQTTDAGGADVDNALAALARMINVDKTQVPLPQVIPALLNALPLRVDFMEGEGIFSCIATLLSEGEPTVVANLPLVLSVMAQTMTTEFKYDDKTKGICQEAIKSASNTFGDLFNQAVGQMPADGTERQVIEYILAN